MPNSQDFETFASRKQTIHRSTVSASASDGVILRGYRYELETKPEDAFNRPPLLCLASDTGNSGEFHSLALTTLHLKNGDRSIITLDMRGRGRSDHADPDTYVPIVEAEDVISFCDAMGLHRIDLLAAGASAMTALLVAPRRPGLIRSIVFNDSGPERDGVGIARTKAIYQRLPEPSNWDEATDVLKQAKGNAFPILKDNDWLEMAQMIWHEEDGAFVRTHDPVLTGAESRVDFDERQPTFWKEFAMFNSKPVLVIRGEHSLLMTTELTARMKEIAHGLQEVVAEGQGHPPMLGRHGLPKRITDFLNQHES